MRFSRLFGHTLREAPAEARSVSYRLALRAGLLRPLAPGLYAYLPLGWRVVRHLEARLRETVEALGFQEVHLPWSEGGSDESPPSTLPSLSALVELARREVRSYRDLPRALYQVRPHLQAQARPGEGLLRPREALHWEAWSLHATEADLDAFYARLLEALGQRLQGWELEPLVAEKDEGHALLLPHPDGGTGFIGCPACGYRALSHHARLDKGAGASQEALQPVQKVATPDCPTIAAVADYLGVPTRQTLKAVFYADAETGELVFVVIRGDLEVDEVKLRRALGGRSLRPAQPEEVAQAGAAPGYASPVGLPVRPSLEADEGVIVVADDSITQGSNFVAGANEAGYHLTGVNYPRDFAVTLLTEIALVQEGHPCPRCRQPLEEGKAILLGEARRLGSRPSRLAEATYLDANGQERPILMGHYHLGVSALMAALLEKHHDDRGICWPPDVAPYQVHLIGLGPKEEVLAQAEQLYERLQAAGYTVLYDDRDERAGVKFADADLVGCPIRLTVSRRSLQAGGVEVKRRHADEREVIPLDALLERLSSLGVEALSEDPWNP